MSLESVDHVFVDAAQRGTAAAQPAAEVTDRYDVLMNALGRESCGPKIPREIVELRLRTPGTAAVLEQDLITVVQLHEKTSSPAVAVVGMTTDVREEEGTVMRSDGLAEHAGRLGLRGATAKTRGQLYITIN